MKISARNQIAGKIVEIKKGATTAHVRIDIGGAVVTSSITNEAVDALNLAVGQNAYAVIKASDVMIAVDYALGPFAVSWKRRKAPGSCLDAFSSREPVPASLENAIGGSGIRSGLPAHGRGECRSCRQRCPPMVSSRPRPRWLIQSI